ncbi:membrane-associated guanylate kinase, WW and PDZ domain-containing protein 1 isoform X2 [Episyrphus balteatus]|uniref:membrane-associated guanylate kinase, WW and PDZ domain-containing protein 1 isoform X2 n=1 Tax=Episyrphus balteatus TaxID=286459 RepID=UPI002485A61E|nr:membrane-associated guanylate kinase, WW and PDZ domain-containing protein 1 isoform X2 [Episyrphus balteatus]
MDYSKNTIHNYCNGTSRDTGENGNDGLGPLPPKWETAYTERGELYFIDHNTGTSHWLDPRLSKFQKKSLEDCGDNELPYGWEKIDDALYGTYYIDHVNRRTQYENPVLEAKRRAAEQTNQQHQLLNAGGSVQRNEINSVLPYKFTKNPQEMQGERITTTLLKSSRGLGITIVGGDDNVDEFLQIKSIVPNGPAWLDGQLQTGDILVYVNDTCVLGFTHHEMVNVFQSILPGETVTLEVCRGYPLPFDPNDPNTEVVTTIAVDGISSNAEKNRMLMNLNMDGNYNFLDISDCTGASGGNNSIEKLRSELSSGSNENYVGDDFILMKKPEILTLAISKGGMGFGFTIADSAHGQKVKKILDRNCCKNLHEGDILLEINNSPVNHMTHCEVVRVLKDCPKTESTTVKIQRGNTLNSSNVSGRTSVNSGKFRKVDGVGKSISEVGMFRSKTPTADLYSTQPKEILPIRPKTPLVDTRRARVKTPSHELNDEIEAVTNGLEKHIEDNKSISADAKSTNSLQEIDCINNDIPFMDPYPKLVTSLSERLAEASLVSENHNNIFHMDPNTMLPKMDGYENTLTSPDYGYNSMYDGVPIQRESYDGSASVQQNGDVGGGLYSPPMAIMAPVPTYHQETCYCYECQDYQRYKFHQHNQTSANQGFYHQHQNSQNGRIQKRVNELMNNRRKTGFSPLESHRPLMTEQHQHQQQQQNFLQLHPQIWNYMVPGNTTSSRNIDDDECELSEVTLERRAQGFGFRIVGGTEEGSQVTVGHVVPGGAADGDPGMATGDEILSIDGVNVVKSSHHKVVSLMGEAALRGQVTMILRRRVRNASAPVPVRPIRYPYDVIVSRHESEGFGFVIISSSNQYYGSAIGKLIPGSPADRCGDLKVGDRIVAVNRIDIAGMSHGDVVNLIKESGLHVRLTIGSPKEDNPILNPSQSSPVLPQLKSDTPTYFDRSHISQYPQL